MTRLDEARARANLVLRRAHGNLRATRTFLERRRRDRRFRVLPFDAWEIANAAAVALTVLFFLVAFFDPPFTAWQAGLPETVRRLFAAFTDLGQAHWILIGTAFALMVALLRDSTERAAPPRLRARRAGWSAACAYLFLSVAASGLAALMLKYAIGRARPRHFEAEGVLAFKPLVGGASWASFPSGHATTAAALAVALALLFPRLRLVFLCAGFLLALSRLVTRSHYPSDVAAGCLLGGLTAWLLARAFAQRRLVFAFDGGGRLLPSRRSSRRRT